MGSGVGLGVGGVGDGVGGVGTGDGTGVGAGVGVAVGFGVGTGLGNGVGSGVGSKDGSGVGTVVGSGVGSGVGSAVGAGVGGGGTGQYSMYSPVMVELHSPTNSLLMVTGPPRKSQVSCKIGSTWWQIQVPTKPSAFRLVQLQVLKLQELGFPSEPQISRTLAFPAEAMTMG